MSKAGGKKWWWGIFNDKAEKRCLMMCHIFNDEVQWGLEYTYHH